MKYTKEYDKYSEAFYTCDYCKINKEYIYSTHFSGGYIYACSEECTNILIFILLDRKPI